MTKSDHRLDPEANILNVQRQSRRLIISTGNDEDMEYLVCS